MKYPKIIFAILLTTVLFAACSSSQVVVKNSIEQPTATAWTTPEANKNGSYQANESKVPITATVPTTAPTPSPTQTTESQLNLTQSDAQGAVTVDVKPENLSKPGDKLIFDVSMNTHSVDLIMDLAQLAVLTTDTGKTIQAIQWDAPRGGHHVEGKLSFPTSQDGKNLLDGASSITITIKDVDVPARTFIWQLKG